MKTIKINRGFYTNTLNENEVDELLTENAFLKSILLMVFNGSETWENEHEVEFSKKDAFNYLKENNVFKGYDKKYIDNVLKNLIN
jgi:hypothetical protein